eukprot:m51a1_g6498 hypothetical protein (305) ;mRNA; f:203923-204837
MHRVDDEQGCVLCDPHVAERVLWWLGPLQAARSAGVCRAWRLAASSGALWSRFCSADAVLVPLVVFDRVDDNNNAVPLRPSDSDDNDGNGDRSGQCDARAAYAEWHGAARGVRRALARLPHVTPAPHVGATLDDLRALERSLGYAPSHELCALLAVADGLEACDGLCVSVRVDPACTLASGTLACARELSVPLRAWRRAGAVRIGTLDDGRHCVHVGATGAVVALAEDGGAAEVLAGSLAEWIEGKADDALHYVRWLTAPLRGQFAPLVHKSATGSPRTLRALSELLGAPRDPAVPSDDARDSE